MSVVIQKLGVLKKNTVIHTEGNISFNVEKGTIVSVTGRELRFQGKDLVAFREGDFFYVRYGLSRTTYKVVFPDGGTPYPFIML